MSVPPLGLPLPTPPAQEVPAAEMDKIAARLRPYLGEPFFAPLSALIRGEALSKRRSEKLEQYRSLKQEVVNSLSAELGLVRALSPSERRGRLVAVAERQAEAVAQVEALAEEIRQDLLTRSILETGADWETSRDWKLGDSERSDPLIDQIEVLQAAAAFGPELALEQRGLLRELAMEVLDQSLAAAAPEGATKPQPDFFFTPSTARIRIPRDMPEALRSQVAAYQQLKDGLKEELRTTVFGHDKSKDQVRTVAYRELREAQAARLAQLETLAEEIRVGLLGCVLPEEPPSSPIPEKLAPQIDEYLKAKSESVHAFAAKLAEVKAALPEAQAEIVWVDGGYRIVVAGQGQTKRGGASIVDELPAFHAERARLYAELVAKKKALLRSLEGLEKPLETSGRPVDSLLQEFSAAQAQRETWSRYRDYRNAVLEPGLSAGQRRLLFSAVIESLLGPYLR